MIGFYMAIIYDFDEDNAAMDIARALGECSSAKLEADLEHAVFLRRLRGRIDAMLAEVERHISTQCKQRGSW